MAIKNGAKAPSSRKPRPLNYFYLNASGHGPLLHKKLHINLGADTITAWCYPLHKRMAYTYSDVKKHKEPAFTTIEVGRMLNRGRLTLEHAILRGNIEPPQHTYGLNEFKRKFKYMWHEKDIFAMHAFLSTVHKGPPRKDGLVTPMKLPNERELRAMIRQQEILYRKVGDEFRPVWEAGDFD